MEKTTLIGRSGQQWHFTPTATGLAAQGPAAAPWTLQGALAYSADLDADDRPHLAAVNQEGQLAYWQLEKGSWRGEEVPVPAGVGVALYPHLFVQPKAQLFYLWQTADGWQLCRSERTAAGWTAPTSLAAGQGQPRLAVTLHHGAARALLWQRGEISLLGGPKECQLGGGLPIRALLFSGPHLLWLAGDHTPLATYFDGTGERPLGTLPPGAAHPAFVFGPQGQWALAWSQGGGLGLFLADATLHHLTTPLNWQSRRLVDGWGDLSGPRRYQGLVAPGAVARPLTWTDLLPHLAGASSPGPPPPLEPTVAGVEAEATPPDPRQSRYAQSPTRRWLASSRPPNG